jgi:hypothetical protein
MACVETDLGPTDHVMYIILALRCPRMAVWRSRGREVQVKVKRDRLTALRRATDEVKPRNHASLQR